MYDVRTTVSTNLHTFVAHIPDYECANITRFAIYNQIFFGTWCAHASN